MSFGFRENLSCMDGCPVLSCTVLFRTAVCMSCTVCLFLFRFCFVFCFLCVAFDVWFGVGGWVLLGVGVGDLCVLGGFGFFSCWECVFP